MSFKKRAPRNVHKRKREEENDDEHDTEPTEDMVARTKLVQQGRQRNKGLDIKGEKKRKKTEDDSDFAALKVGFNHFQPQVDLPDQLKQKMESYVEENLKLASQPQSIAEKDTSSS